MSFLNPLFLAALITVGVPLLIYLLNIRKPRKVQFSTLAFFESLKTTALKRIRIKRWLLLTLRMLAVAALAIALSRPFLPSGSGTIYQNEPMVVGILIDNSPAMDRVDRDGPYIEQALEIAGGIISMAGSDDRIDLNVTHGEGLTLPLLSPGGALNRLDQIGTEKKGNYLGDRISRMKDRLRDAREPNKVLYLISDFRESTLNGSGLAGGAPDEEISLQMIRVGNGDTANTGYRDVDVISGAAGEGAPLQLRAELENFGSRTAENQFLSLYIDDELISQQPFTLGAGETETFTFELPGSGEGQIAAELLIEGDELSFDNRYYASIRLPETRSLLVLGGEGGGREFNSFLRPLLEIIDSENDRFDVRFSQPEQVQPGEIFDYDGIVLDGIRNIPDYLSQALTDHLQAGAGILLLPAADGSMSSYNRLLSFSNAGRYSNVSGSYGSFNPVDRMAIPTEGHPVLDAIFDKPEDEEIRLNVPELFYLYDIESSGEAGSVTLLQTRTGRPLIEEARVGNGRLLYSAIGSDPGWSNFPVKPFFAPFFFRTADYLVAGEGATLGSHTLGEPFRIVLNRSAEGVTIEKAGEEIIPQVRQTFSGTEIRYDGTEWEPGWLILHTGGEEILYSANLDAMESSLKTLGDAEADQLFATLFENRRVIGTEFDTQETLNELQSASFGREIWFWFIIAAILLLVTESLVSRIYKAETIE